MARLRSPSYPSVSLQDAIGMIEKIHSEERTYDVERSVAAQHLGYTGITGHSAKILSALLQYGLLEKVAKNEVRVSDTAVEILHPDNPQQKNDALRRAAFNPVLFSDLHVRFPDGVPSEGNLRSYLVKQGFSDRAIGPAINAYLDTCEYAQQTIGYESHGEFVSETIESPIDQLVVGEPSVPVAEARSSMPPVPTVPQPKNTALNDINAEIFGGLVRINALLDAKGLEKLKQKIEFLQSFIGDDENEAANAEQSRANDEDEAEKITDLLS